MTHLGLTIFVIFSFEILNFFKFFRLIKKNIKVYKELLNTFFDKKTSDEIKEKLILNNAKDLFIVSLKNLGCLAIILILFLLTRFFFLELYNLILTVIGIIEMSVLFIVYTYFRKFLNGKL